MEKGCILKAEMAKKNLHIKRTVIPSATTSTTTNSSTTVMLPPAVLLPEHTSSPMAILSRRLSQPQTQPQQPQFSGDHNQVPLNSMDYESFLPLPSDLLSPTQNYKHDPFLLNDMVSPNTPTTFNDSLFCIRSRSFDNRNNNGVYTGNNETTTYPFQFFSKSEIDADPFHYMSKSTPVPHHDFIQGNYLHHHHHVEDLALNGRKNSLQPLPSSIERPSSSMSNSFRATTTATTTVVAPNTAAANTSIPSNTITTNSANQNPPCNTLYVGNLPPSTNEDELRLLFEKCEGYKRMCFRNKPQGPMCFVEFEAVEYAAHAMNEHQGHLLSNSVKGGIRLSFSKNPLFIKPTKGGDISFNFKQMGTALLADL